VEIKLVVPAERYPAVPNPLTVDCKVESNTGEEMRVVVPAERYPKVPSPLTVDWREDSKRGVLTILIKEDR
jgi:hypothetical protein